ncbi:uncharacterized protein LOC107427318 isoform X2 [Ziziphus jujuba]|uniref:Uncharacterized protein LOC107427318 isoform X2 n=1 Tax=Ziziphus jujuba TaxID=326968 RepID=A0ABM3ZSS8_ZIZJJ|nr:uncharacterized protein LOC107427318 isoform X2 [Ziziphus jujuba]XP_060667542.1 uncharacterized protein LOC107427318 isoform X2 [Ziziphus jujuba]
MEALASSSSKSGPQPQPKIIFVLNNLSLTENYEDDFLSGQFLLPRPLEIICDAYAPPLQFILETPLNMLGRIGAVCLSFGSRGYYEIIPAAHAGNALSPNAIRELLVELFRTHLVLHQQHLVSAARYIASDEQHLTNRLPANSLIIGGCQVKSLVVVINYLWVKVGGFARREIANHIGEYVRVSGCSLTASSTVAKVCIECMNALGID